MSDLSFINFNWSEGVFWVILAVVSSLAGRRLDLMPRIFWHILSFNFVLFGMSDFAEAYYQVSPLESSAEWLFYWKLFCLVVFAFCLIWYLVARTQKKIDE